LSHHSSSEWEETYETRVAFARLPHNIRAFVVRKDCYNTIVINENLSQAGRLRAYRHELEHIREDDFHSELTAGEIELKRHK